MSQLIHYHNYIDVSYESIRFRFLFFFFNDTATTEIYTLSLHDALPISQDDQGRHAARFERFKLEPGRPPLLRPRRSEEHTSELQSQFHLVCRLLLEKKKQTKRLSAVI